MHKGQAASIERRNFVGVKLDTQVVQTQRGARAETMLDSLNGNAPHIAQRINLAFSARASIDRITKLASSRGWNNLRLLSSAGNSFQSDYFAETEQHGQMPMANVFVRRDGAIHHYWGSELLYGPSDADSRHIDLMWPLWNIFDTTPEGRGADWYPKLKY